MSVEADLPALNAARPLDRSIDVHLDSHWGLLMNTSVVALPRATGPRPLSAPGLTRPGLCPGRGPARQAAAVEQPPQPDGHGQQRDREPRRRQRGGGDHP